jgi:glycosyltransferase involved in cell wall biosynthesis
VRAVRALADETAFAKASAAARERAEHYSWDSSARILLALAERVRRRAAAGSP